MTATTIRWVHDVAGRRPFKTVDKPVHVHDLHATIRHLMGIDHTKLTYRSSGRDFRLTDVSAKVLQPRSTYDDFMTAPFLEECFSVWTRAPATLDTLLRDLPEAWTAATEGPGTWSPYVVIGHLIHCEKADWMPRLAIILEHGPSRPFDPFDREAQLRESNGKPLSMLLDEFGVLRRDNLARLRALNLQPAQLELLGTHPQLGPVQVRQLLA